MILSKLLQLLLVDRYALQGLVFETNVVADVPAGPVRLSPRSACVSCAELRSQIIAKSYRGGGMEPSPTMFRQVSGRKSARSTNVKEDKMRRNQNILR